MKFGFYLKGDSMDKIEFLNDRDKLNYCHWKNWWEDYNVTKVSEYKTGGIKMITTNVDWFEDNNLMKGYKWSVQAKFGIVEISQDELFNRIEFATMETQNDKIVYAVQLGWRFNVDNQMWYRIKGN